MTDLTETQLVKIKEADLAKENQIERFIPERYRDITEEEINNCPIKLQSYYIFGGVGTGKTRMAFILIRKLIEKMYQRVVENIKVNKDSYFYGAYIDFNNFPKMLDIIRRSMDSKDYQNKDMIGKIARQEELLILDDIGAEKFTEWSIEVLYKIINERYENKLETILISNLSLSELAEKVGDRITSRIAEMCEIKKVEGEDKRLKK